MRRRGATLLVGAIVVVLLVVASFAGVRVPYVALTPGPTWNTLGSDHSKDVIQVSGGPASGKGGQLRLVTVGVEDQLTLFDALRGWLSGDDAVVPREVVYPPNESQQQVDQENAQEFKTSQNAAVISALRALDYAITVVVTDVSADGPAVGHLLKGDVITSLDGQPVTSADKLNALVQGKPVGTTMTVGYQRAGAPGTARVTTVDQKGNTPLGIQVDVHESGPHQYKVAFGLANVGGPSAGLMFTLGIIDKIGSTDLTGGKVIAGTGTIDEDGNVGAIGGIPQKMRGAHRDGATVFLAPASNCAEAVANAVPGLELIKVNTLDDALQALHTLRSGGTPPLCAAK